MEGGGEAIGLSTYVGELTLWNFAAKVFQYWQRIELLKIKGAHLG